MKISIVIPCYNEAANLPLLVSKCRRVVTGQFEIILVDNGSDDNTPEILGRLLAGSSRIRSVRVEENKGYGFGILAGLAVAKGEVLGWTHADLQADPADLLRGMDLFNQYGRDIFVKGRRQGCPFMSTLFTLGMGFFAMGLMKMFVWDINAQPTMFSRKFFESWKNPPHDFYLDLYAYYHARLAGLNIFRFPVKFYKRTHGASPWGSGYLAKIKLMGSMVGFGFRLRRRRQTVKKRDHMVGS